MESSSDTTVQGFVARVARRDPPRSTGIKLVDKEVWFSAWDVPLWVAPGAELRFQVYNKPYIKDGVTKDGWTVSKGTLEMLNVVPEAATDGLTHSPSLQVQDKAQPYRSPDQIMRTSALEVAASVDHSDVIRDARVYYEWIRDGDGMTDAKAKQITDDFYGDEPLFK